MSATTLQISRESLEEKVYNHEVLWKFLEQQKNALLSTIREMLQPLALYYDKNWNEKIILEGLIASPQCENKENLCSTLQENQISFPTTLRNVHSDIDKLCEQVQLFQNLSRDSLSIKENIHCMNVILGTSSI
jgi:hypothetical protein